MAERPAPRRLRLGLDAWAVLREAAGLALVLPAVLTVTPDPFPAGVRSEARAALAGAAVLAPDGGVHPSVLASLQALAAPDLRVALQVEHGPRDSRHAVWAARGRLVGGLTTVRTGDGEGPVELTTAAADDLAEEVLRGIGEPGQGTGGRPLLLDATEAVAAVQALTEGRGGLAAELAGPAAAALADLTGPLQARALLAVGPLAPLVLLRGTSRWWTVGLDGSPGGLAGPEGLVLVPLGTEGLRRLVVEMLTLAWPVGAR